jgi:hypothetical protein
MSPKKETAAAKAAKPAAKKATAAAAKTTDKPKKARTSYIHFCNDHRAKVIKDHPEAPFTEIGQLLGQLWREADDKTKAKYKGMFEAEKAELEG